MKKIFTFFSLFILKKIKNKIPVLIFLILFTSFLSAQTTGKLSGRILDENGEPLGGANVLLEGTTLGAASDFEGYYVILNIRAGSYTAIFRYLGYQTIRVEEIKINSDQTTVIDITMSSDVLEGETVTVTAQRPLVEFNQTSSVTSVSRDEIELLPVQNLSEIVNLQAGVVDGHFRGGRLGEVQFQVDGVTVNNPYNNSSTLQLDRSVLQEVQVISGTFDAKYGSAMSGVVNAVLRTGSSNFEWSGEIYGGDYYTTDANRYPNNKDVKPYAIQNYQLTFSGPALIPNTTFFLNGRRYMNEGHLFGERRFLPTDKNDFEIRDFNPTGDGKLIAMNTIEEIGGQVKLTNQSFDRVQLSYQAILNLFERKSYNHGFRFNPDGTKSQETFSITHGLDVTHTLSDKMFYRVSIRNNFFDYRDYKYEDLFDPRYIAAGEPRGDANFENGAVVQGVDLGRFIQKTNSGIVKADFTIQADRNNLLEAGVEGQISKIEFGSPGFIRPTIVDGVQQLQARYGYEPEDPKIETFIPKQIAAYVQDRIELGDLVVRAGLRLEYFDANATIPSDLQNPANSISGAPLSVQKKTTIKSAIAPRLGFSFPLTDMASVYFSYGHFYQMPNLAELYANSNYLVLKDLQAGGISYGVMGNPDLDPQITIQYEVGLKQALSTFLGFELSFFIKI
jgi:outer membrane receptor protein involved in Fe transport